MAKAKKKKISKAEMRGRYLATKMANSKPMTKRDMAKRWPTLSSDIDLAIDWIEANTTTSDNPFLFVWNDGQAIWGFRSAFGSVAQNLAWNLRYLMSRLGTTQRVIQHSLDSPVVEMTQSERRAAKAVLAQMGGTEAFLGAMIEALVPSEA